MDARRGQQRIVVAGAGYAGLRAVQRLQPWLRHHGEARLTLVDRHPYHELVTELPRLATGTRQEREVRIALDHLLPRRVTLLQATVTDIHPAERELKTDTGALRYDWLVLALGSIPNNFDIPGLPGCARYPYSSEGALAVWEAVNQSVRQAAAEHDPEKQWRLMTVVIGGGGATGVELAGALAEELPRLARKYGAPNVTRVILVEAGPTLLGGSSPRLIGLAEEILDRLGVEIRTDAPIAAVSGEGFRLQGGKLVPGSVLIWAGGVAVPPLIRESGLPVEHDGRLKVDQYLRVLGHPHIFAAGDVASAIDRSTGRPLPPLAQVAIEEGETVAHNLAAAIEGSPLRGFRFEDRGFVVSLGSRSGVARIRGVPIGGRLAHALKDAIEWDYRQSVRHG